MEEYIILEEAEVQKLLDINLAESVIEECFNEKSKGDFLSHPKINIKGVNGSLRITPGESKQTFKVIGFRLYDVIREDFSNQPQPIIVYNNITGKLKGIVISQLLGAYRTAAINTVMQKFFNGGKIEYLGVVGTGFQAKIHTEMYVKKFRPKEVFVYGRTEKNVTIFIQEMKTKLNNDTKFVKCRNIEDLSKLEVLLLATRSNKNLLDKKVFSGKKIITTIGPKLRGKSELSDDFAKSCDLIVTDSIEQVKEYGERFFIKDLSKIKDFSDLLKRKNNRIEDRILLCSVGMGGTEVALAGALIKRKKLVGNGQK